MTLAWSQIDEPPAWVHVDASDARDARDVMIADGRDRIAWRLDGALYVVRDAEPVAVAPWWSLQDAREVLCGLAAVAPRETLVVAACAPVRTVLHLVPAGEERPRVAIETAERWARGEASLDEVRRAARAAYAAYAAADAAAAAAAAAAAVWHAARAQHLAHSADVVRAIVPLAAIVGGAL